MAWWDDAAEAVGSAVGWLGDGFEAAVDVVTEVAEEVTETVTEVATEVLDGARDGAASISPALGAVANVVLGVVKGAIQALQDACAIVLDTVRNVGSLVNAVLHLDLAGVLGDLGNLGINALQAGAWVVRVVTGAYFGAAVSDYFMRDRALGFIRRLVIEAFGEKVGKDILRKLGWGTIHFGLPVLASVRIMRADSDTFPFVALHEQGILDLFALAGLLSFDSFQIARERTRVVRVDDTGNDMWYLPVHRTAIRSFLDSDGTSMRLRAYAMEPGAASRAMRTARKKFKKLCIDLAWDSSFHFPTFQSLPVQPCTSLREFRFFDGGTIADARWFAVNTPRDGRPDQDGTPLCIGVFGYADGKFGLATGRDIKRGLNGCGGSDPSDTCITRITRLGSDFGTLDEDGDDVDDHRLDDPCGCGCTWRDAYPPYFSRLVLAHELGHYFGLAHAGHDGVHNIMFKNKENTILGGGSWRLWSHGDPNFVEEDVEHAWRFIVKKMPHILRAL
jgi:hypothetical protein